MQDRFKGGSHTDAKIHALSSYLSAYSTALKHQNFRLVYIDAFAGSGSYSKGDDSAAFGQSMLDDAGVISMPGSARIALETVPPFQLTVFIEKNPAALEGLRSLVSEYPQQKSLVLDGDANSHLVELCRTTRWLRRTENCAGIRAVLFLDPFAISVNWETLVTISETQAIDVWYLLNVSAIGRLLQRDFGKIPDHNRAHLDRVLGPDWWETAFYRSESAQSDMFPDAAAITERTASAQVIEKAFIERMKAHFGYVHPRGLPLYKDGQHWFSLLFMMSSRVTAAHELGKKFARSIIDAPQGITRQRRG